MKKSLAVAPTDTPISLAEAKASLLVEHTADDTLITGMIEQATDYCESQLGFYLMQQDWRYYFDCVNGSELEIQVNKVISVQEVGYRAVAGGLIVSSATPGDDYYFDLHSNPLRIKPIVSWPSIDTSGYDNFQVVVRSGYSSAALIPKSIKTAIYLIVGHLYRNRESVTAIKMHELPNGVSACLSAKRVWDL